MQEKNSENQPDPIEQTMRKVVVGFIAISIAFSFIFLWLDNRQMKQETITEPDSVQTEQPSTK